MRIFLKKRRESFNGRPGSSPHKSYLIWPQWLLFLPLLHPMCQINFLGQPPTSPISSALLLVVTIYIYIYIYQIDRLDQTRLDQTRLDQSRVEQSRLDQTRLDYQIRFRQIDKQIDQIVRYIDRDVYAIYFEYSGYPRDRAPTRLVSRVGNFNQSYPRKWQIP